MKTLETARLLLRPFVVDDANQLYQEIYSDSEVLHYYDPQGVRTPEATRQYLIDHYVPWSEEELGRHAVTLKADGTFLGQAHLTTFVNSLDIYGQERVSFFENPVDVKLACAFGRRFWGQGYAMEACAELMRYTFEDLRLPRLFGSGASVNTRARILHKRLGFHLSPNLVFDETEDYLEHYVAVLDSEAYWRRKRKPQEPGAMLRFITRLRVDTKLPQE